MVRWLGVLCLMAVGASAGAQCSPDAGARAATIVRQRQDSLLEVKVDQMATEVPSPVRVQISALKEALAGAVDEGLHCAAAGEDAAAMQSRLAKLLAANRSEQPFTPSDNSSNAPVAGVYGANLKIAVSAPTKAPQMRAVEVHYGIECGDDTILLLYASTPKGWHRILRWQSPPYSEISGAFGDLFAYTVIPGDRPSALRVAVAHGTPWCTSRFSGFKLDLLEPAGPAAPRLVWHIERGYSRGDFAGRLLATDDGFELRVNAATFDVSTSFERTVIYRYRVAGDQVTRIPPIATNGRGFVEEWLDMPWDEAKGQTAPEALAGLKAIHDLLAQSQKDAKTNISYSYGPVRACSVQSRYEVEMDADPGGRQFYAIQQGQNGYTMVNFGTTPDKRCTGLDLMKK